jgi:hypothetical protein
VENGGFTVKLLKRRLYDWEERCKRPGVYSWMLIKIGMKIENGEFYQNLQEKTKLDDY